MALNERVIVVLAAVASALLQVFIAPHIAIGYAFPNFIAAVTMVLAIAQPNTFKYVLPFVMGLVYDFMSGGPVGAMAFSLLAASSFAGWLFGRVDNDSLFMGLASAAAGMLVVELLFGAFLLMFGFAANLFDAFVFRVLPCFLYNAAIAAVLFPVAARFLSGSAPVRSEITQLH